MNYTPEELLPVVKELTERFTGKASTSVTYETAQQLMGAVLYCIEEAERGETYVDAGKSGGIAKQNGLTAGEAYEEGYEAVLRKVGIAKEIYHEILDRFQSFGNRCLEDTVIKGMPEFFKWYDARFCPQDRIILLDYPILLPIEQKQGIDAIYLYLKAILAEQIFLEKWENAYVRKVLEFYALDYKNTVVNLSYLIMKKILVNMILDIPIQKVELTREDYNRLEQMIKENEKEALELMLKDELKFLISVGKDRKSMETLKSIGGYNYDDIWRMSEEYFKSSLSDLATELKNGAVYGSLENVV